MDGIDQIAVGFLQAELKKYASKQMGRAPVKVVTAGDTDDRAIEAQVSNLSQRQANALKAALDKHLQDIFEDGQKDGSAKNINISRPTTTITRQNGKFEVDVDASYVGG